jgi:hypothetical protein
MSETARRIRILIALVEEPGSTAKELAVQYSPVDMVSNRITRLEEIGQIRRFPGGEVTLTGRNFVTLARVFRFSRRLALGKQWHG